MSKGLGAMQQSVLAVLAEKGRCLFYPDIVRTLCERDDKETAPALQVSVRRAISSLAKRNLVCSDGRSAWLPTQTAPTPIRPLDPREVERRVLAYLGTPETESPEMWFHGRKKQLRADFQTGDVFYELLQGKVSRQLCNRQDQIARAQMAIYRAVLRLEKQGKVGLVRLQSGHIGLVRLQG